MLTNLTYNLTLNLNFYLTKTDKRTEKSLT